MPWVFVLIWSTGFIVARFGMAHAPPLSFLSLRYALSSACLGIWITLACPAWPKDRRQAGHLAVVGVLMQAGYLGGVWSAVKAGMGAGTVALLVGLQPLLTAWWVARRGAGLPARQWSGLALGLLGVVLVLRPKLGVGEVSPTTLALAMLALASITAGTLYQKRFAGSCDVRTASLLQQAAALAVTLPLALLLERQAIEFAPALIGALAWSVLVLTLGGSSLLYLLIQRGAATQVSSLMYLVPPCTALLAWMLFGEVFTVGMAVGLALTAAGVALVTGGARRTTIG
ncbi:MAG TPA: DMT family transporter [Burkholderiaceae bacterium]|nr:DMT family transporter [Burkholderiaceae bacterium]